jgi:hypothetical protein
MAQSYSNPGGTGNRNTTITVTTTATLGTGSIGNIIDGTQSNNLWWTNGQTGREVKFDFGAGNTRLITEAKWYQDATSSHGTWQWQGSNDNTSWDNIGATFTLGGIATQTQTTLSGNTTRYRYYRLLQSSGATSSSPFLREIEFLIDDGTAPAAGVVNQTLAALTVAATATLTGAAAITWEPDTVASVTLSGGNLIATNTGTTSADQGARVPAVYGKSVGKFYFEITLTNEAAGLNVGCGVATTASSYTGIGNSATTGAMILLNGATWADGSNAGFSVQNPATGHVIGIAVDLDNGKIWFKNITDEGPGLPGSGWNGSTSLSGQNPNTGAGGIAIPPGTYTPICTFGGSSGTAGNVYTANFGASAFAGAVPSGFVGGWISGGIGTLTSSFDAVTLAATATLTGGSDLAGVLAKTLDALTIAATGKQLGGRLEPFTFANATLVATGRIGNAGVLAQTLAALTLTPPGLGVQKYGELTRTLAALTLAGIGTAISGRLDAILGALTLAGTGAVAKRGKLERTLAGLSLAATGTLANRGVLATGGLGPVRMLALGGLAGVAPGTPGVVSQQTFFFAWTDEASEFSGAMLREDEQVFGFELTHEEGDFATLRLDLKNPRVGLLAAGRNVWCWFSWRDPATGLIEPLLHGRLIGIPEDITEEVVRLQFVARPSDYIAWKKVVAESLKVRPFWDPVWISEGQDDPDTVLEARPSAWHIDRVSLDVTASDTIIGEDGTLLVTADDHFYDGLKVAYGDTPLKSVSVTGTVTWTQQGSDVVDLTPQLWQQFQYAGNPYEYPMVSSFTGYGLFTEWPNPGDNIGGGWSMDATSGAAIAVWQTAWLKSIVYVSPVLSTATEVVTPGQYTYSGSAVTGGYAIQWKPAVTREREYVSGHETIATVFPLVAIAPTFSVRWEASRARTEIVRFAMVADTQDLLVDPGDDETDKLDLSSDFVGQGVDPGGALPLGDLRRNSYFNTDRGNQSVEYLIMLARAKILARARAVNLTVETPFAFATRLSCRWNATIQDPRLPGGEGTGKVTSYTLSANGDSGELKAKITVACTIGRGNTVMPDPGEATYSDGYTDEYQARDGATLDAGTSDILYESFDGMIVLDDDGLDLFRMTPDRIVQSLTITNGPDIQQNTLDEFYREYTPPGIEQKPPEMGLPIGSYVAPEKPTEMMSKMPTTVSLELVPISKRSFETVWEPAVSALMVPRTIDLEAPYV